MPFAEDDGAKLSVLHCGAKLSLVPNCPFFMAVPNCPFFIAVPNCPFFMAVPNCPLFMAVPNCPRCQIVLGAKLSPNRRDSWALGLFAYCRTHRVPIHSKSEKVCGFCPLAQKKSVKKIALILTPKFSAKKCINYQNHENVLSEGNF